MEVSNRVLTVSYGTFSCSLEGFDDPFSTLQQVAEYFRKLSAEDRYFGGEPQVPDNSTIHKIAEAANQNKVEAEVQDSGIVLRQAPEPDLELTASDLVEQPTIEQHAEALPETELLVEELVVVEQPVEDAQLVTEQPVDQDAIDQAAIDLAKAEKHAKHQRNRAAKKLAKNKQKNKSRSKSRNRDKDHSKSRDSGNLFRSRRHKPADQEHAENDTISAKRSVKETLAKIRRNVEQAEDEIIRSEDSAQSDTLILSPANSEDAAVTEDIKTDVLEVKSEDTTITAEAAPEEVKDLPSDEIVAAPEDFVEKGVEPEDAEKAEDVVVNADDDSNALPQTQSSLSDDEEDELAAALQGSGSDDTQDEAHQEPAPKKSNDRRNKRRERAQALRNNTDVAREDEALDRLLQTTNSQMDGPERSRRRNALNQLKAAVAATEADSISGEDTQEDLDELAAYREDLLKAQRNSQGKGSSKNRPSTKRPSRGGGGSGSTPAPAPLILVSEQRIDAPQEAPEADVVHREAAEIDGNLALQPEPFEQGASAQAGIPSSAFQESSSFRDFADQIGAVNLQDMLEAAAAYTSIVEGKPRFSRAQVMSKLAKISTSDAFSKEAGLRSFGKLLREGKILRVQDGQFAISKSSRFSIASRYGT